MAQYSLSKIQCFESCKMRFNLSYIQKVEQEHMSFFKKGSKVHSIFENLDKIDELRKVEENAEAIKIADNFLNSEIGKEHLNEITNAQKEKRIGLKISNKTLVPCEFSDKECLFRGIIDVLNENHILDYKTGHAKSKNQQDYTQLSWYAIWLFLNSDFEEIKITYLYVEHNKENSKVLYRKDLNTLIIEMLQRIKNVKDYEENPIEEYNSCWHCQYCPVRKHCKKFKENEESKLENIDFEKI